MFKGSSREAHQVTVLIIDKRQMEVQVILQAKAKLIAKRVDTRVQKRVMKDCLEKEKIQLEIVGDQMKIPN